MDLALRTLRDGPAEGAPPPLLVMLDEVAVLGGPALLRQAAAELASAIAGGRAHAAALTVVALAHPAAHYQQLQSLTSVSLMVLDCCTDPYGWGNILGSSSSTAASSGSGGHGSSSSSSSTVLLQGILAAPDGLQQLEQHLRSVSAASGRQQCIVIDSASTLLDRFGAPSVARLLHSLQAAGGTSSLLCCLHTDLHAPAEVAAIEQLASGSLVLQPTSELERSVCKATHSDARDPQGRLLVRLKRKAGRVRAETQLYCIDASGAVTFLELPADLRNPQAVAEKTVAAAAGPLAEGGGPGPGAAAGALAQQMAGGMKLTLSQSELEAKQRVQLPFEHQGQGAAYQTGDFRDYLPPEAGGNAVRSSSRASAAGAVEGAGQQRLGHILYVRDSGSEHDSDEDPDDDLDL